MTLFDCLFGFPFVLNFTATSAVSPGFIGSFGQTGTVQPQVASALVMIKSVFPEFVTLNTVETISPSLTVPKSYSVLSKLILAAPLSISTSLVLAISKLATSILELALDASHEIKIFAIIMKADKMVVLLIG